MLSGTYNGHRYWVKEQAQPPIPGGHGRSVRDSGWGRGVGLPRFVPIAGLPEVHTVAPTPREDTSTLEVRPAGHRLVGMGTPIIPPLVPVDQRRHGQGTEARRKVRGMRSSRPSGVCSAMASRPNSLMATTYTQVYTLRGEGDGPPSGPVEPRRPVWFWQRVYTLGEDLI